MTRQTLTFAYLIAGTVLVSVGPALASNVPPQDLPAPGVLGLVAMGVLGAIALVRSRK